MKQTTYLLLLTILVIPGLHACSGDNSEPPPGDVIDPSGTFTQSVISMEDDESMAVQLFFAVPVLVSYLTLPRFESLSNKRQLFNVTSI